MAPVIWQKSDPWDVVVIGSGATGGWAAHELGRHGLRVLVLEAGADEMDAPSNQPASTLQLKRTFDRVTRRRRVQSRHAAYWELDPDLFVVDQDHPYEVADGKDFQWIRTRSLNGRLLTWGGIGVRTSDYEFRAPEQDGFGTPWPFGYAELAPHYDRIDAFLPVYGERDELPQLPDGRYVGAPRLTDAELLFRDRVNGALKRQAVIAARGVLVRPASRPLGEAPPPSPVRAASTRFGVQVRTDSVVSHLLVDSSGRANGVAFVDRLTKQAHEVRARSIAVCASTLESTRILLNSRSRHHPDGLGNSSGVVGRYLMDHPAIYLAGYAPGVRETVWNDGLGGPKNLMVPRFHNLQNRAGGAFLRGFGMFGVIGRTQGSKDECDTDEVPLSFVAYGEMLPRHENHVTLHPKQHDAWGIPILRIDCALSENERAMQSQMADSLTELVELAGGRTDEPPGYLALGGFVHEMGTVRMGHDAKTSALNGFGQSWDVPNVFVMDGAAWPSGAWQNPTFTMMAIAGRACEHLAESLKQGRL
jgi:choline dehydrogenase-like flavoprotein